MKEGNPIGIIGYDHSQPIAWCSVSPFCSMRNLAKKIEVNRNTWAISCFFISRPYRHQGVVSRLIKAAEDYARDQKGKEMLAFPVRKDSPTYHFMGFIKTFEKAGYQMDGKATVRRYIMRKKIG